MKNATFPHRVYLWLLATAVCVGVSLVVIPAGVAQGQVFFFEFEEDHLKCYEVSKDSNPSKPKLVDLFPSQFKFSESCKLSTRAKHFCAPTVKESVGVEPRGNDPRGPELKSDFLCYKIECVPPIRRKKLLVNDQFGKRTIEIKDAKFLCTPTEKVPCKDSVAPECGGECPEPTQTCQPTPTGKCDCQ